MNVDGSGRRQLTHGRYDDFDARYLPDGEIVFLSTRKGQFLQMHAEPTRRAPRRGRPARQLRALRRRQLPARARVHAARDGRRRAATCGRSRPSRTSSGRRPWPATAGSSTRAGTTSTASTAISSASGRPTPTAPTPQLVYGNYTVRPQVVVEAAADPRLAQAGLHGRGAPFDHRRLAGAAWTALGAPRATTPLVRLTPEVPFPETEANIDCYYANPWPLSEEHFLVALERPPSAAALPRRRRASGIRPTPWACICTTPSAT